MITMKGRERERDEERKREEQGRKPKQRSRTGEGLVVVCGREGEEDEEGIEGQSTADRSRGEE